MDLLGFFTGPLRHWKYMQSNGHPGLHTEKDGFVVHPEKCWLGASPDAWVIDPSVSCSFGIAEFKCPFSMAKNTVCNEESFYCSFINGRPRLERNHQYFHQVQLQLYVTGVKWCDFCEYTLKAVFVERIDPDHQWQVDCVSKLDNFFFDCMLPELINPKCKPSYYL